MFKQVRTQTVCDLESYIGLEITNGVLRWSQLNSVWQRNCFNSENVFWNACLYEIMKFKENVQKIEWIEVIGYVSEKKFLNTTIIEMIQGREVPRHK